MAEARSRDTWMHTSALMALIANANRDPKKRKAFSPSDFDPHAMQAKRRAPKDTVLRGQDLSILKTVFVPQDPHEPQQKETDRE